MKLLYIQVSVQNYIFFCKSYKYLYCFHVFPAAERSNTHSTQPSKGKKSCVFLLEQFVSLEHIRAIIAI